MYKRQDDVLSTGGTARATINWLRSRGAAVERFTVIVRKGDAFKEAPTFDWPPIDFLARIE